MKIVVTGAAGFIGFHLTKKLINQGVEVLGIDNFNDYYDKKLKEDRYKELQVLSKMKDYDFKIENISLENYSDLYSTCSKFKPTKIVNLAAQAGVRYSITNPSSYIQSNIVGFSNVLEICRNLKIKNLIYASSSSVYGGNKKIPFREIDSVNHPISLYAASKKSNELMAHTYSHLYNLPSIGLRFFTVYGPWGRPDMALFKFTKNILSNKPITVFNNGNMTRDFTYIDDVIESIVRLLDKPASINKNFNFIEPDPSTSWAPYNIFNVGNSQPTNLQDFIKALENELGINAIQKLLPMQQGDVEKTSADSSKLYEWINYKPTTNIHTGIKKFVKWYRDYYSI